MHCIRELKLYLYIDQLTVRKNVAIDLTVVPTPFIARLVYHIDRERLTEEDSQRKTHVRPSTQD